MFDLLLMVEILHELIWYPAVHRGFLRLRWLAGFLPSTVATGVAFACSSIAILQAVYLRLPLALPMSLAIKVLPRQLSFFATLVLSHGIGGAN